MRVLFLHAEDVPHQGPWASTRWDLIVDLAFAGPTIYEQWSKQGRAPVRSIHEFAGDGASYVFVREILDYGRDHLVDDSGLDWWELIAVVNYHELQALYLLASLRRELGDGVEYFATRASIFSDLLESMSGVAIPAFQPRSGRLHAMRRSFRSARKLSPEAMLEIAFDKWDAGYGLRRHLDRQRAGLSGPAILLPSAYSNVTRLLLQYAADLPEKNFLLAATRKSGTSGDLPGNVRQALLSAYAQRSNVSEEEEKELLRRWSIFEATVLGECDSLRYSKAAGVWQSFPHHLRTGLRLRNAWHAVLAEEPIVGVLCADDLNYHTRIPLVLATKSGLNAVYCYHGALDGGLLFKKPYAGRYLVKSQMERDYLARRSAIDLDTVETGAPSAHEPKVIERRKIDSGTIVFFSQPYEVLGGRVAEIYREVLPPLCAVARRSGRKVVLKLHPFESAKDRGKLLQSVLPASHLDLLEIRTNQAIESVLADAWCGIGVDSSVAAECSLAGVPYFLCGWLEYSGFGYGQQMAQCGAGRMLSGPGELSAISEMIAEWPISKVAEQLYTRIDPGILDEILFATGKASLKRCAC